MVTSPDIQDNEKPSTAKKKGKIRWLKWGFWFVLIITALNTMSIVEEGHIGIQQRVGEAWAQLNPGLHLKIPFVESVQAMDIRSRMIEQEYQMLTKERMGVSITLVANWHLLKPKAIAFYQHYGTPKDFEEKILIPFLQSASNQTIANYSIEALLSKQSEIGYLIAENITQSIQPALVTAALDKIHIKKITLPEGYQQRVEEKLVRQKELEAEQLKLDKEKLTAQSAYHIAEIKADATIKQAEADAKIARIQGKAKAEVIEQIIKAINDNRNYIQYEKILKWDGKLYNSTGSAEKAFRTLEK